ncbi:Plasmid stabilization system protein [compost metagenome]
MLADDPMIGRPRDEFLAGLRSWPVYSFLVFYEPTKDGILVHRIVHGSRDLPQVFS